MGFLDDLTKDGNFGSLMDMANSNPDVMKAAASMLNPEDGSVGGNFGLREIVDQLSSGGLAEQVSSWLSTGANKSVGADQISAVLNSDTLRQFASMAGIDLGKAGAALAEVLPGLIDQLSPEGKAASGDTLNSLLGALTRGS